MVVEVPDPIEQYLVSGTHIKPAVPMIRLYSTLCRSRCRDGRAGDLHVLQCNLSREGGEGESRRMGELAR